MSSSMRSSPITGLVLKLLRYENVNKKTVHERPVVFSVYKILIWVLIRMKIILITFFIISIWFLRKYAASRLLKFIIIIIPFRDDDKNTHIYIMKMWLGAHLHERTILRIDFFFSSNHEWKKTEDARIMHISILFLIPQLWGMSAVHPYNHPSVRKQFLAHFRDHWSVLFCFVFFQKLFWDVLLT